ncbi:hypothetical protein OG948_07170 [Embleya sp. NBC_00888]|uniref:hypothetical protein n=1 Tax=Embleya sp. NBC_00888 TaxID=2975960 RepID=UPI003866ABB3|nr:hypothetical protein OG948_07170 [Embleya sp. NBC_00888]
MTDGIGAGDDGAEPAAAEDRGRFRAVPAVGYNGLTAGRVVSLADLVERCGGGPDGVRETAAMVDLPVEEVATAVEDAAPYRIVLVCVRPGDPVFGVDISHFEPRWARAGHPDVQRWFEEIGFDPDGDEVRVQVSVDPGEMPAANASMLTHSLYVSYVEDAMALRIARGRVEAGGLGPGRSTGEATVSAGDPVCKALTAIVRGLVDGHDWWPGDAFRWVEWAILPFVAGSTRAEGMRFLDRGSALDWADLVEFGKDDLEGLADLVERAAFVPAPEPAPVDPGQIAETIGGWGAALSCRLEWPVDAEPTARELVATITGGESVPDDALESLELSSVRVALDPVETGGRLLTCTPRADATWQDVTVALRTIAWRVERAGATRMSVEIAGSVD